MSKGVVICGVVGCIREVASITAGARRIINNIELCRACYQRFWKYSKEHGLSLARAFDSAPPVRRCPPKIDTICSRPGCQTRLSRYIYYRVIGDRPFCNSCFQYIWRQSRKFRISLLQAFLRVRPKGWRELKQSVTCAMPNCESAFIPQQQNRAGPGCFVCGQCRKACRRAIINRQLDISWETFVQRAILKEVILPGYPEPCAASWCRRLVVPEGRGPHGEPLCLADNAYLRLYMRRKGISLADAIRTAPPPRLLHTRR